MMRRFLLVTCLLAGLPTAPVLADMELNGAVATENFVGTRDGEFFDFRNANWFQLKVKAAPHEQVSVKTNLELRNTNFTQVETIDELWDRGTLEPISWRINEAYVDLFGFLVDTESAVLDLRVGKQVLGWGEADGFNPTNKFDPLNLENPHDFKEKLGNISLKASLYVGDEWFSLEGVVVPRFLPSVLPIDLFIGDDILDNPLMPSFDEATIRAGLPPGFEDIPVLINQPGYDVLKTTNPVARVGNVMAGARIRWAVGGFDWTVSYAHARESIPVPRRIWADASIVTPGQAGCTGDASCLVIDLTDSELIYPKVDVLGFNIRGSVWDIGVWGEAAVIFPQRVDIETVVTDMFGTELAPLRTNTLDGEAYTKWVVGAEYTFSGGYYFNLQWVHGFFVEMAGPKLHDYLFMVFRKSVLSDKLAIEINLGGELDHTFGRNALGWLGNAQVTYKPYDGAQVVLGYLMARGEDGTTFQIFEQLDQAYLKFRTEF